MVPDPRSVAERWASAGVSYDFAGALEHLSVLASVDGEVVGDLHLQLVDEPFWSDNPCAAAVRSVLARLPTGREPRVFVVRNVNVYPEHRGKGIGLAMYEKVLAEHLAHGHPAVLIGERCVRGKTSRDAERVWLSLSRRWVVDGLVAGSARR